MDLRDSPDEAAFREQLRAWLRGSTLWDERYTVETVSAIRVERVRDRLRALHAPDEELATGS